jgi:hypothetical protein
VSQPSQAPAFSYPNHRPIRAPLSRAHRNRVFVAGALSNTVLSIGLTIVSLAGILLFIVVLLAVVWAIIPRSNSSDDRPLDVILAAVGLSPDQAWVAVAVPLGTMILGALVSGAGIWIGKDLIASAGVARPWAVSWSATGILVGLGLVASTVISPVAAPLMTIVFGAVLGSGSVSGEDGSGVGVALAISIVATVLGLVFYAAVGSLVWWWMAHVMRRAA